MAIHAEAVDVLVRKGRFEPDVALGVAEAIEVSITLAQLVTVPILDSRVQDLKNEIQAVRADVKVDLGKEVGRLDKTIATEVGRLDTTLATEIGRLDKTIAMEVGRLDATLATEIGRLDKTIATEVGRLDATLATEIGRLDKTIATEVGRLDATLAAEIGRLDKTIATEIGRIDTTLATEIAKCQERLSSELGETNAEMASFRAEMMTMFGDLGIAVQKMGTEIQTIRAEMVRWVLLAMLSSLAISLGASTIQKML